MYIKIVMAPIFNKKKLFCNLDLLCLLFIFMVYDINEFLYFSAFHLVTFTCTDFFKWNIKNMKVFVYEITAVTHPGYMPFSEIFKTQNSWWLQLNRYSFESAFCYFYFTHTNFKNICRWNVLCTKCSVLGVLTCIFFVVLLDFFRKQYKVSKISSIKITKCNNEKTSLEGNTSSKSGGILSNVKTEIFIKDEALKETENDIIYKFFNFFR